MLGDLGDAGDLVILILQFIALILLFCDFEDSHNILSEHKAYYSEASSQLHQEKQKDFSSTAFVYYL